MTPSVCNRYRTKCTIHIFQHNNEVLHSNLIHCIVSHLLHNDIPHGGIDLYMARPNIWRLVYYRYEYHKNTWYCSASVKPVLACLVPTTHLYIGAVDVFLCAWMCTIVIPDDATFPEQWLIYIDDVAQLQRLFYQCWYLIFRVFVRGDWASEIRFADTYVNRVAGA